MKSKYQTPDPRLKTQGSRGFTLLELLIVITIIGIASAVVGITLYGGMGNLRLKSSVKEVASALRYARSLAVSEKNIYSFSLDPEKKSYYVSARIPSESPSPPLNQVQGSPPRGEGWVKWNTLPEGVILVNKDRVEVLFYPLGSSTGGEFSLSNEKGSVWTIRIDPITGKVSIFK